MKSTLLLPFVLALALGAPRRALGQPPPGADDSKCNDGGLIGLNNCCHGTFDKAECSDGYLVVITECGSSCGCGGLFSGHRFYCVPPPKPTPKPTPAPTRPPTPQPTKFPTFGPTPLPSAQPSPAMTKPPLSNAVLTGGWSAGARGGSAGAA